MELVTLRAYRDPVSAHVARAILDEAGIPSFVWDEHVIGVQWLYSTALGGAKLKVARRDVKRATEVLARHGESELGSVPEGRLPAADGDICPECGSGAVEPSRLFRSSLATSLCTGLPLIAWRRRWICHACGHTWKRQRAAARLASSETSEAERLVQGETTSRPGIVALAIVIGILAVTYFSVAVKQGV